MCGLITSESSDLNGGRLARQLYCNRAVWKHQFCAQLGEIRAWKQCRFSIYWLKAEVLFKFKPQESESAK